MSTQLAVVDVPRQTVQLDTEQLKYIANTEFVPKEMRGNLPMILACVAYGRELGIGDMTALNGIDVIDGRPSPSAELCVYLVNRAGHELWPEWADDQCTAKGKRGDSGREAEFTFTTAMAERAGLLGKNNWKKYPEAMLWARAATQLCRSFFADCLGGTGTYTAEELGGDDFADVVDYEAVVVLTEPGADHATPAVERGPASDPGLPPGSVSDLADLRAKAQAAGITDNQLGEARDELFPGKPAPELDAGELQQIWLRVSQEALPV